MTAGPVTPVEEWTDALARRRLPRFDPAAHRHVVVLAAHPDDETLGVGGCMQLLHRSGARITLVVATDGEAAYPSADSDDRRSLGLARRKELADALAVQGLADIAVHWLGLPDSALTEHVEVLRVALVPLLLDADAYLAPWSGDPHPDHRAAGLAAAAAAPPTVRGWSYPIWMWAWCTPDDPRIPLARAYLVDLDAGTSHAKRGAVECFTTQVSPGPDGSPPVLTAEVLAHAGRREELLFREPRIESAPMERFADLYAGGQDPWSASSWYERRKRALVMASLPRERYRSAFEPGCGTGELTVALASRCASVLASEPVPAAAERARAAVSGHAGVRVRCDALPHGVPGESIDLAVFSEVLYYLDDETVHETMRRTVAALEPGGDLVVVHWRGWPAEAPRDAVATHTIIRDDAELDVVVDHVDENFLLIVLRRR